METVRQTQLARLETRWVLRDSFALVEERDEGAGCGGLHQENVTDKVDHLREDRIAAQRHVPETLVMSTPCRVR